MAKKQRNRVHTIFSLLAAVAAFVAAIMSFRMMDQALILPVAGVALFCGLIAFVAQLRERRKNNDD